MKRKFPDVLGMNIEDAKALLQNEGVIFAVKETTPTVVKKNIKMSDKSFVIRVREIENKLELTVCKI